MTILYKRTTDNKIIPDYYLQTEFPNIGGIGLVELDQETLDLLFLEIYTPPDPDPVDLEQELIEKIIKAKKDKNEEINAFRLNANFSTFSHQGKLIACDNLSRSDIDATNGYISLTGSMPVGWPGGWKAVDNSYIIISTVDDWKSLYSSLFAAGNSNFAHSQILKNQLGLAQTLEEIEAIVW